MLELSVPVIESDSTAPHVEVETTELATRPTESIFIEKKIQLTLEQESLLREAEEPITFSGIVQLDTLGEEQIEDKGLQFNGLLRLELREPSTSQVLFIWESPLLLNKKADKNLRWSKSAPNDLQWEYFRPRIL